MPKSKEKWIRDMRNTFFWFPEDCRIESGWRSIVEQLCRTINGFLKANQEYRSEFRVTVCKQKYGHLMFYAYPERAEIEEMIEEADWKAYSTCELCGAPGKLRKEKSEDRAWVVIRCDRCLKE